LTSFDYFKIHSLGFKFESNLKTSFLNFNIKEIASFIEGKSKFLSFSLINSEKPLFLLNSSIVNRGFNIFKIDKFLNFINPSLIFVKIQAFSNSSIANYINFKNYNSKDIVDSKNIIFLNCKESQLLKNIIFTNLDKKVFWLNSFNSSYKFENMTTILFKNIYEETGTYFNLEFRPQTSYRIFKNNNKYSLFHILMEVFPITQIRYKYNSFIIDFLEFSELFEDNNYKDYIFSTLKSFKNKPASMLLKPYSFKKDISDFFKGSLLTEKSKNMLTASRHFRFKSTNFF